MGAIQNLCKISILLERGQILLLGPTDVITDKYLLSNSDTNLNGFRKINESNLQDKHFIFQSIAVSSPNKEPSSEIPLSSGLEIKIEYKITEKIKGMNIAIHLVNSNGITVLSSTDVDENYNDISRTRFPGTYIAKCFINSHYLRPGRYSIGISSSIPNFLILGNLPDAISFDVIDTGSIESKISQGRQGVISPILHWQTFSEAQNGS